MSVFTVLPRFMALGEAVSLGSFSVSGQGGQASKHLFNLCYMLGYKNCKIKTKHTMKKEDKGYM